MIARTIQIILTYKVAFLDGLRVTIRLCLIVWIVGLSVGTTIGVLAAGRSTVVSVGQRIISFTLSGVPILVFLFWAHYPLQVLLGIVVDPFVTAAVVLTLVNIFAVSDVVRSVLQDLPAQYVLAARACGLSRSATLLRIRLPLILRHLLPALLPVQIVMLHTTLFASLISVQEIFRVSQRINSQIYKPVEIYTALGLFFLMISLPANGLALWLRSRFTRDLSES